jgi:hypothetical protein
MAEIKSNKGFITIQRQIIEWEWYDDANTFRLFFHILIKANHTDKNYRGTVVKRGTFLTGLDVLSKETGLSMQQTRTCLSRLKSTNEITIKTSSKGSVIQVVKYNDYQSATSKVTNQQQTNNKRTTTTNNDNNDNNENNTIPSIEEFVKHALTRKPNLDTEDIKLKYYSWVDNDWCINRKTGKEPIKNWKASLTNTVKYLKERYKQPVEPIAESIEERIARLNNEHKQLG